MRGFRFIARKELYHILRDIRSLLIVLAMPVMMTFLFGYAINLDIRHIKLDLADHDNTEDSRALAERFYESGYFRRPSRSAALDEPAALLRAGGASAVLVIRPGFARALALGSDYELGLVLDGSEVTMGSAVLNYAEVIVRRFAAERRAPTPGAPAGPGTARVTLSPTILYNPDLRSAHFLVPGIVAIILLMVSALLTSITVAREKETGTIEQLLTTPASPLAILLGKLAPYLVIALLDGILVLVFARILFQVPLAGSALLLAAAGLLYVLAGLSIGILISVSVATQQVAMQFALLATMLPSIMLSGFIFAIRNMPPALQGVSRIVPATYFLVVIRGIMLKAAGLAVLAPTIGVLALLSVFFMALAYRRFRAGVA